MRRLHLLHCGAVGNINKNFPAEVGHLPREQERQFAGRAAPLEATNVGYTISPGNPRPLPEQDNNTDLTGNCCARLSEKESIRFFASAPMHV